ncbi:hypothetical protein, conserved [Trypanosoma brucei brucei TREU927]|uniref:CYC2-like cyclin n=1 Tax=Trypanosoma brucei brucei (strain 927/4 GUTat10.1) TaxID=185431 RepID=Q57YN6_TRYB2|nr:hypothetical protein, conserved [Trypanosoma brucei brucei TREU927]AAX69301.1 hypothetical protein, conserved [Trypanosoma brucei]AAZ13399.1 hypothetical protein, conserved [Trypanosoma brucei brucei TREU927]
MTAQTPSGKAHCADHQTADMSLWELPVDEPFPLVQLVLSIHTLYNLPPELGRLDPRYEQLEIVMWPVVKYTYRERRIMHLPLPEHVFPVSVTAMVLRGDTYLIDFDGIKKDATCESSTSLSSSPSLEAPEGSSGEQPVIVKGNSATLQFPCPTGLRAVVRVSIGVRQRRLGFSAVRWITENANPRTTSDGIGVFSVATEEVYRTKLVTRVVGHSVGAMICSLGVNPYDGRDVIVQRLLRDKERFTSTYVSQRPVLEKANVEAMLRDGYSEQLIYRHMLLLVEPNHYKMRLEALFTMYDLNRRPSWWRDSLLQTDYILREEELIRRVCVEIGPECSATSPRYRLWAFRKKYSLSETSIVSCLRPIINSSVTEALLSEPGTIFAALTRRFGCEPLPTAYLFPPRSYEGEYRTFIFEALSLPLGPFMGKYTDVSHIARAKRAPFTSSPYEQPLAKVAAGSPHGGVMSEVDALRAKHAPEFVQIVPPIAAALRAVVEQSGKLPLEQQEKANAVTHIFCERQMSPQGPFHDFMHRLADLTFISPATLLGAAILLDRLCMRRPDILVTELNAPRLFLTSARVVSKVLELRSVSNRCFANAFGVNTKTLNLWEEFFIKMLKFDLCIKPQEFKEYTNLLFTSGAPPVRVAASPISRFRIHNDNLCTRMGSLTRKCEATTALSSRSLRSTAVEIPNMYTYNKRYGPRQGADTGLDGSNVVIGREDDARNASAARDIKAAAGGSGGSLSTFEAGTMGCLSHVNDVGIRRGTEPTILPRKICNGRNLSPCLTVARRGS